MDERQLDKQLGLGKSIAWNSLGSFVYLFSNWLITVLVVVLAEDYSASGALAVAMAVGNLVATITLFNVRPFQVTDVDGIFKPRDYVGFRFITVASALLICFAYSLFTVAPDCYAVVAAYAMFKGVDSFVDVLHGVDQLSSRLDYAGQSQIIRGVLIVAVFAIGMIIFQSLVASILGMALVSLAVVLLFDVRKTMKLDDIRPRFSLLASFSIFKGCLPGFASALLCAFVVSYSRQWYGFSLGSELLGIYAAIATPAVVVQAFAGYIYSPLLGPIAKMWHTGNYDGIRKMMARFFIALLAVEGLCFGLFFLFGHDALVLVYGNGVAQYTLCMIPVLLCTGMTAVMIFLVDLLVSFRLNGAAVVSGLLACLVCVMTVSGFVDIWDMNGISYCIIISFAVGSFGALICIARASAIAHKH